MDITVIGSGFVPGRGPLPRRRGSGHPAPFGAFPAAGYQRKSARRPSMGASDSRVEARSLRDLRFFAIGYDRPAQHIQPGQRRQCFVPVHRREAEQQSLERDQCRAMQRDLACAPARYSQDDVGLASQRMVRLIGDQDHYVLSGAPEQICALILDWLAEQGVPVRVAADGRQRAS